MRRNQTPEEALREIHANISATEESIEKTRAQVEKTAQETYEFALENFHGDRGYQRIQDFADANGITFREAMIAIGNEICPKAPEPAREIRRELTEARLEAHVAETGLSYREAMVELAGQGYVLESGEEETPSGPVLMSEEEERAMFGITNREIEAYASSNSLSYRDAMIELSARPNGEG